MSDKFLKQQKLNYYKKLTVILFQSILQANNISISKKSIGIIAVHYVGLPSKDVLPQHQQFFSL